MMPPPGVDLTIPLEGLDTKRLLADWRWVVPEDFEPIQLSKFSEWFFSAPDGRIHRLELIEGTLLQVAKSRGQFEAMREDEQMRNEWFQAGLVFRCSAQGLALKPDECYGWRVHPMLGGKLEFENIQAFPISAYQGQMAQLLRGRKGIEAGNPVSRSAVAPMKDSMAIPPTIPNSTKPKANGTKKKPQVKPGKRLQRK